MVAVPQPRLLYRPCSEMPICNVLRQIFLQKFWLNVLPDTINTLIAAPSPYQNKNC